MSWLSRFTSISSSAKKEKHTEPASTDTLSILPEPPSSTSPAAPGSDQGRYHHHHHYASWPAPQHPDRQPASTTSSQRSVQRGPGPPQAGHSHGPRDGRQWVTEYVGKADD